MMSRNGLDIRGSDYCLLLELFAQSAWAGSILFKEYIQTLNRTPNEPCFYVLYWVTLKLWSFPELNVFKKQRQSPEELPESLHLF